jgi:F-type H+-transporting ATPase subunit b
MKIEIGQIITQIISFLIMLWVMKRYAWKPLLAILDERRDKIQADLDAIEQEKARNAALEKEYQAKLDEIDALAEEKSKKAIEEGKKIALKIQNEAHSKAKEIVNKSQEDLQKELLKAKTQLKNEIVDMALLASEKVLQMNLDTEKQKSLILDFVEKMESP